MGGKTSTSTSQVSIPPEVLARYNAVNARADQVANTPFQQYSTDPNAFVAPINAEQTAGINATNTYANAAQPYIGAATDYTVAGGAPVNLQQLDVNRWMSPYLNTVLGSTAALLNQNNQQQQSGALGSAIESGAFGGDRAGIAAANLEQQQNLGNASIYSGIANTAYNTALATGQQQQSAELGAEQANRQAVQQTGQNLATLGANAQQLGLAGAQAEQAAGATQQQTEQAGKTALYNQFLQQQSYPFQVAQFLANIAEGTGALSGSTTTTTQPQSIFSDERLKEDVEVIGKTFSGENVVAFRYKGDPTKRIGLIAQDVEKKHPEAVHEVGGFKAVDYDKATEGDAKKGRFYKGGLVPANDDWMPETRKARAAGGYSMLLPGEWPSDISELLSSQVGGPYGQGGLYGSPSGGSPRGGLSYVPSANLPVGHLAVAQPAAPPPSMISQADQIANLGTQAGKVWNSKGGQSAVRTLGNLFQSPTQRMASDFASSREDDLVDDTMPMRQGGLVRSHRDMGGSLLDIPDQKPDVSLPVAKPPSSSNSGGLGDIISLAAHVLPFIPGLASGGSVRKGYDDGGSVDPADSWNPLTSLAGDVAQVGRAASSDHPENLVPVTDPLSAAVHYGIQAGKTFASSLGAASPAEQTAIAGGLAGDNVPAGIAGGMVGADQDTSAGGTLGSLAGPPRVPPSVPPRAARVIHAAHAMAANPVTASMPNEQTVQLPSATMVDPNLNPTMAPGPQIGRIQPYTPTNDGVGDPDHPGIVSQALSRLGGMHFDRDTIFPILSAIAAAGAVPTVHPGVALAAGLGAYANASMGLKQQEAAISAEQAQSGLIQSEAFRQVQPAPPAGTMVVPGPGPDGKYFVGADGKPAHYAVQGELIGGTPTTTNSVGAVVPQGTVGAQPAGQTRGPILSDYKSNTTTLGPSSQIDEQMKGYGIDPTQPGVANRARAFAMNPALEAEDQAGMKLGQDAVAAQPTADNTQRNLVQLAVAVNSLPKEGLQTAGAGYEYRQQLANVYQTAASILGLPPDPSVAAATNASQIIDKIRTLSGVAIAHQNDEKAAAVAQALTAVLPGGSHQIGAADDVLSNMMVQNQRDRDFPQYFHSYVAKYGTAAGVQQAFQHDMNPIYMRDMQTLPRVMARRADGKMSPAEMLLADPTRTQPFEVGGQRSDGTSYPGFGEGIARYWR